MPREDTKVSQGENILISKSRLQTDPRQTSSVPVQHRSTVAHAPATAVPVKLKYSGNVLLMAVADLCITKLIEFLKRERV